MNPPDTLVRIARRWGMGFLLATGVGLLFAAQIRYSNLAGAKPVSWGQALYWGLGDWYEWALLSPVIFWLAGRFSFSGETWGVSLPVHLFACLALATVHTAMCAGAAVFQGWFQGTPTFFADQFRGLMAQRLHFNLAVCSLLVAGWHAWKYYVESRTQAAQAAALAAQLAEARLQALRMQLDPHFLFNTLNSISAMMLQDVSAANQMLAKLGEFLRRTLETSGEAEISLRHELDFARQYLDIERVRFGPRLSVRFSVDAELLDAAVPNLLLQPLAENAIRHGVERSLKPVRIEFSASCDNNCLSLSLRNSGGDMPESSARVGSLNGVVLTNTRQRLRQLYGEAHTFTFDRDGTFMKLTNAAPALEGRYGGSWADFDNDGWLDLFAASPGGNSLYRNQGDGTLVKVNPFAGTGSANSWSGSWGGYNRDGWVDLFISNGAGNNNALLRNNGDGSFTRISAGRVVRDGGATIEAAWQDYDGDGWPDLYAANNGGNSFLYHNLQNGSFERTSVGAIATDSQNAIVPDWGDCDNDGWPDLAVGVLGRCLLYRNLGDHAFQKITSGPFVTNSQNSEIVLWIDYDNDGWLDLFSANAGNQNNTLYHNNGDGTFAKITTGSVVNDGGNSAGAAWADYDNDGFLDLFVGNWQGSRPNFLYRNNGNTHHWLKVKCVGTVSNRDGIGARIHVKTAIRGQETWQLREISGGTGFGQTSLLGHFGLGNAAIVDTVRIEWPSGAVQELRKVIVDQTVLLTEPPRLQGAGRNGANFEMTLIGIPGSKYLIDTSEDLHLWNMRLALTNVGRTNLLRDPISPNIPQQYYRARTP